ncbi:hypothetical protein EGW08_004012 [Elysia chlorotica]|uniref:Uncharacterized protein n=1 Tax=Elysia chlorotica TaxID=188477 RepID=A0A3S1ACD8_ELYCH|nr:hypothetical protein EGW08_004012 [Elysia chlorotica]
MFIDSERTTMLTIGLLLTVAALVTPGSARHFQVIDPESNLPCVLLDVSFNIKVTALKDGDVAMVRYLTPDDTGVRALGECINGTSEITVNFGESSMWALAFQPYKSHPVAVYRVFQFIPKEIFGSTVYLTDLVGFSAPKPIYLGNASHSYRCDAEDVSEYLQYTPALSGYTFKATVTVFDIHTQGMGLTDSGQFGPAEICPAPVPGRLPSQ